MQIGIDTGALCGKRLGNYVFTKNLIESLNKFDKKNIYYLYSFCNKKKNFNLGKNLRFKKILPKTNWINWAVRYEESKNKKDIFLGLNQSFPNSTSKKIIFSHGLSFIFYKNYYPDSYRKMIIQVEKMINSADYIIVSSSKVKAEFESLYGRINNIRVIPFGIPFDFHEYKSTKRKQYFLNVGMNHPIKNIEYLVNCFNKFQKNSKTPFKLYLVTDRINKNIKNKNIIQMINLSRKKLQTLYRHAAGYLTSSYYESFNFPVLEALSQNCRVISLKSSVISEMREYVNIAKSQNDFIKQMNLSVNNVSNINIKILREKFSWKKYIDELIQLYRS